MTLRNIVLLTGLAAFQAGCVVTTSPGQPRDNDNRSTEVSKHLIVPRPIPPRGNDNRFDNGHDNVSAPSYEGYDYARIVFINDLPYYVYDNRQVRPIPPRLHDHFRRYSYGSIGRPLVFSRDTEVRDGYAMSRIVFFNNVPYHVTDDRIARPLPGHLHQRFRAIPSNLGAAPANDNPPQPPNSRDDDRRDSPPGTGRELTPNGPPAFGRVNGPNVPPAYGRVDGRNVPPAYGRERNRMELPPVERGPRNGNAQTPVKPADRIMPPGHGSRQMPPMQQEQASQRLDRGNADKNDTGKKDTSGKKDEDAGKKGGDKNKQRGDKNEGKDDDRDSGKDKRA